MKEVSWGDYEDFLVIKKAKEFRGILSRQLREFTYLDMKVARSPYSAPYVACNSIRRNWSVMFSLGGAFTIRFPPVVL